MAETLKGRELAERLPESAEFNKSRRLAISAIEVVDATREQLEAEVAARNAELEEQGLVGKKFRITTTEELIPTRRGPTPSGEGLLYTVYGFGDSGSSKVIAGIFEGLVVVDSKEASSQNVSGLKIRNFEPERLIVCVHLSADPASRGPFGGPIGPYSLIPLQAIRNEGTLGNEFYDNLAVGPPSSH